VVSPSSGDPGSAERTDTTSARHSLWFQDVDGETAYAPLDGDARYDVAILGGGIAGLTLALRLKRDGVRVAVLESARVGAGVTGCTTAKVSALQSTVYTTISRRHGNEVSSVYAAASQAGVERLAELIEQESIECDLFRAPACTYASSSAERHTVEAEARAAEQAGLPVELVETVDLPFQVHGAVRLSDQLQLHPVRYVHGLAAAVDGDGSRVFENSRALTLRDGSPCTVSTAAGTVSADHVVVATHYPVFDRGLYFARLEPERSYCIAARLRSGKPPREMSISAGSPTRSVRSHGGALIVGGEGHPAGSSDATQERFAALEVFARTHWDVEEVTHRWSAQDPTAYDHLPMIGAYLPGSQRISVATGFMKWGLATATFAADILADRIAGRTNDWAAVFSPSRVSLRSTPDIARLGAKFAADLIGDRLRPAEISSPDEIPPGEARVLRDGAGKIGVYRDHDGDAHAVSLRCTHLGCLLRFNAAETSWDCPCHGSRFDIDGEVLEGPATQPLPRRTVDTAQAQAE
jgi:glycine/D-amino acid oxidase-like deaminating enzyme/nitrite reductase/ring-hydroxylating ferredoxin subunit